MAKHEIPKHIKNSDVIYFIDEYVRYEHHRDILKDHWFRQFSINQLEKKYNISASMVKNIIYNIGDEILLMMQDLSEKNN